MTRQEAGHLMQQLLAVFDRVRLVDPEHSVQYVSTLDGMLETSPLSCCQLPQQEPPCESCMGSHGWTREGQQFRFEFVDGQLYQITAKHLEVEGEHWLLEMVN